MLNPTVNKSSLQRQYDYFDSVVDVTLRALQQLDDKDIDYRATPEMRSLKELVMHIFAQEECHARGVLKGEITHTDMEEAHRTADPIRLVNALVDWAGGCHTRAKEMINRMTDSQLASPVKTPYGTFPGWQMLLFSYDEHWHHRGQIYTYIRLLGKQPLFLYDYKGMFS